MNAAAQKKLEEFKSQHGDVVVLDAGDVVVFCRKMTRVEWRKFLQATADDRSRAVDEAGAQFRRAVLHPPMAELEPIFDEDPSFETNLAGSYLAASQSQRKIDAKKA